MLQNSAARILTIIPRHHHITPILFHLHWLPVKYRIIYKILIITFKCLTNTAPIYYLQNLVTINTPSRTTRQSRYPFLYVPKTKLHSFGDRSYSAAAPRLFNSLPPEIRSCTQLSSFQSHVKHHLFNMAFPQLIN